MPATVERRRDGAPPLSSSSWVMATVHLWWLSFAWAALALLLIAIVAILHLRGETPDTSVWEQLGIGVQGWVIFAAGVMTVPVFISMFVGNGVTRRQLGRSAMVTMGILAVAGSGVTLVGFGLERLLAGWTDWTPVSANGEGLDLAATAATAGLALVVFSAYFASGWLVGIGFTRWGAAIGIPLIVPSLLPVLAVSSLITGPSNPFGAIDVVDDLVRRLVSPPLSVGVPVSVVVVVVALGVAQRRTREVPYAP